MRFYSKFLLLLSGLTLCALALVHVGSSTAAQTIPPTATPPPAQTFTPVPVSTPTPTLTPTPGRVVPTPLPTPIILPGRDGCAHAPTNSGDGLWAFEATFNGDPSAPSQTLLPCNFDFAATHRTHPGEVFAPLKTFPADHGPDCAGPNPLHNPLAQHQVSTSHFSGSRQPDPSFYICKNHMMSSVGHVSGYSITSFWPKQEFDFSDGGILEFDVNINGSHPRTWFEVLIAPRDELKINSARSFLPH